MRKLWAILFLLGLTCLARAEPPRFCAVCQEPLRTNFFWLTSPALPERLPVCQACTQVKTLCFVCGVPVKSDVQKLDDGRWLCERDAKVAVFSRDEAQHIFDETRRELRAMFADTGALPDKNISVGLVNAAQLEDVKAKRPNRDQTMTLGLTLTHRSSDGRFAHAIMLLDGVGPARLAAVAAHEWTHAWLHENLPAERRLHEDAVEGFCEWIAYRLMCQRNEAMEKRVILANTYSHGQINALAIAEGEEQFARVVDWMKYGTEPKFEEATAFKVVAAQQSPETILPFYPEVKTLVPDTLVLKGIGGTRLHRFALINNRTLEKEEMAAVRVGTSNAVVRCLEIRADSVVVQINGHASATELFLRRP